MPIIPVFRTTPGSGGRGKLSSNRVIQKFLKRGAEYGVDEWQPADILQAFIDACRPHAVIERVTALAIQHQLTGLHSVTEGMAARASA